MGTLIGIIIGSAVFGLVVGALGRLLVPGKQDLSLWRTFVIGFGARSPAASSPRSSTFETRTGSTGSSGRSRPASLRSV